MSQSAVDGNGRAPELRQRTRSPTSRRRWPTTTSSRPTRSLVEAVEREGAEWAGSGSPRRASSRAAGRPQELGRLREREPAEAADPRPLRQPRRRGRVPPLLARADGASGSATSCTRSPWKDPRPGAHVARGAAFMCMSQAEAGVGCPISMTYSVIPALRTQPELAAEWEPRFLSADLRPGERAGAAEGRRARRDGDDREAGRHRRPRQHHRRPRRVNGGGPGAEYELTGHKWFMSAPHVRRLPRPRPGRRRHLLLPLPALDARRRAQPLPPPAPQGQARQPLQRLQRGRVRRRLGLAGRRGGRAGCGRSSRWSTTPASTA